MILLPINKQSSSLIFTLIRQVDTVKCPTFTGAQRILVLLGVDVVNPFEFMLFHAKLLL